MYYIKLEDDKSLVATVREPIYRGENLSQKLTFLIAKTVDEVDMLTATAYLNFVMPDGSADIVMLTRQEEAYNESYYAYSLPIANRITKIPGAVCIWLNIYSGSISDPIVLKSGECIFQVMDSRNMDDYLSDTIVTALYQYQKGVDDGFAQVDEQLESVGDDITEINEKIDALIAEKADSIIFNSEDSTLQLTANGEPIGDKVKVFSGDGKLISSMSITTDGELVVFYADSTYSNLGVVVGTDGKVYVPHVDAHKVLTFTIEDEAGEIPDPVDLNPSDDWSSIDDETSGKTDYVWDSIS